MCKRLPDNPENPTEVLPGLFPGKGQRLEDIGLMNPDLSQEEIGTRLRALMEKGKVTKYRLEGSDHYMLEP